MAQFHRTFVKTGDIEVRHGKSLNRLYELRNVGDYGETRHVPTHEAEAAVLDAEAFVDAVAALPGREV